MNNWRLTYDQPLINWLSTIDKLLFNSWSADIKDMAVCLFFLLLFFFRYTGVVTPWATVGQLMINSCLFCFFNLYRNDNYIIKSRWLIDHQQMINWWLTDGWTTENKYKINWWTTPGQQQILKIWLFVLFVQIHRNDDYMINSGTAHNKQLINRCSTFTNLSLTSQWHFAESLQNRHWLVWICLSRKSQDSAFYKIVID